MAAENGLFDEAWWRFDRYELRDGYIRPAQGASLQPHYNPWQVAEGHGDKSAAPFLALLRLHERMKLIPGQRPGEYDLEPDTKAALLDWCGQHGLVGVLPHICQQVHLAPVWAAQAGTEGPLRPYQTTHSRTYDWTSRVEGRGWQVGEEIVAPPSTPGSSPISDPKVLESMKPLFKQPQVLVRDWVLDDWTFEPLSGQWHKYFPDVPVDQADTYQYPRPLSEEFWRLYAEPLEAFNFFVSRFANAYKQANQAGHDDLPKAVADQLAYHRLDPLNKLASEANLIAYKLPDKPVRQVWSSPSLIGTYAVMAAQRLAENKAPRPCPTCGDWFTPRRPDQRYCPDSTCQQTGARRAIRQKEAEAKKLAAQGLAVEEIAKMLNRPVERVAGWLSKGKSSTSKERGPRQ